MDPLLSRLEALPVELQLTILQHLPPRQTSTLPFAPLVSLSRTSRALYTLVSPLVYAEVRLSSPQQAHCFLDDAPARHTRHIRRLTLDRSSKSMPLWDLQTLWKLLRALPELIELSLDGVADATALHAALRDFPSQRLERLDLTCAQPATNRADYPQTVGSAAAAAGHEEDDPFTSLSHASEPSWAETLAAFPALAHLRLANLAFAATAPAASASLFPDGLAGSSIRFPSGLRSVELDGATLTDGILRALLAGGKVEQFTLRGCTGFTRAGLFEALKEHGGRLRRLNLVDGAATPTASSPPSTPLASPARSPNLLSASSHSPLSLGAASPTLAGILDAILPSLPHLTHLSTSGALFSPALISRLHALDPSLRHLSISAHPHVSPATLLPLVHPSPPGEKTAYLPSLRRLELHRSAPSSPSYPCATLPWSTAAASTPVDDSSILDLCTTSRAQGVHLVGEVFEQVQAKLEWAEREAEKLAEGMKEMSVSPEGNEQHLVTVPHVRLAHLSNGAETLLFDGAVASLAIHRSTPPRSRSVSPVPGRAPPALPPRPGSSQPTPPPYSSLPTSSSATSTLSPPSSPPHEWLTLTLALPGESSPVFEMPISLTDSSNSIVASPPHSYILPNLTGVDPATLSRPTGDSKRPQNEAANGLIKLTLPSGTEAETLDPETRELFEASLYGLYRGEAGPRIDDPTAPPPGAQLYLVDESNGRVLGELATEGGMHLQEDSQVASGHMEDKPGSTATAPERISLDGHEPVVIDSLETVDPNTPSVTYSVKPVSFYRPADNPQNSTIITGANFLSRGIILGSEILSRQFETGAGKYVSSRPATNTPMVFKPETKARFAQGRDVTQTATVYSGKAAAAVGNLASKLGDKIGKSTGIQSQPGGPPPTGWRGALASTLTAVNTVADHLEAGGKTLLDSGSKSASQVIHHKYGSEARGVADDVGGSVKHCALVYIDARGVGRKALLKSVGKSALRAKMADGSELYLTNENGELKQIEASAVQGGNVPLALEGRASGSTTPVYTPYAGSSGSKTPVKSSGGGFGGGFASGFGGGGKGKTS
ncbi:hypothetical protein JCM6882_000876 [Rhodosporidiobolus microsporus]